jgi:hypothetical protein
MKTKPERACEGSKFDGQNGGYFKQSVLGS